MTKAKAEEKVKGNKEKAGSSGGKKKKGEADSAVDDGPVELMEKPREYVVHFHFPNPPELAPPILGIHGKMRREVR